MAIEIKEIDGVICIKGNVSQNQLSELEHYFSALLKFEKRVLVNLSQVTNGFNGLYKLLHTLNVSLTQGKELVFFGGVNTLLNTQSSMNLAA